MFQCCFHTKTCPSCRGSGGSSRRVRCCPIVSGCCCCQGCYQWQWVSCSRCHGTGQIACGCQPAPIRPYTGPWLQGAHSHLAQVRA